MKSKEATVQDVSGMTEATGTGSAAVTRQFFKRGDWLVALATFLFSGCAFYYHMAPEVTLQDSGELVTGAFTFGVPHPPGYPIWAFLGYIWSNFIVPFGNPAWRIGTMSVATGAATVGVLALLMIRSTRVLLHALPWTSAIDEKMQQWIALSVGVSTALLFGFNRGVWLWASVAEMRVLNAFSFILIAYTFFAWMIQPKRLGFLCASLLIYGLSMTNHQTVAVMVGALVVGTLALGLDTFLEQREGLGKNNTFMANTSLMMTSLTTFWNLLVAVLLSLAAVFVLIAWLRTSGLHTPAPLSPAADALVRSWGVTAPPTIQYLALWRGITLIGILGAIAFAEIPIKRINGWVRKILALGVIMVLLFIYWNFVRDPLLFRVEEVQTQFASSRFIIHYKSEMHTAFSMIMAGVLLLAVLSEKGWVQPRYALLYTLLIICGCAFYFYMPVAAATNPPMNWGYAATKEGFLHSIMRGQYQQMSMADPCSALFGTQLKIFIYGLSRQYSPVLCVFALVTLGTATVWMFLRLLENAKKYSWLLFVWVGAIPVAMLGVTALRHVFLDEGRLLKGVHNIPLFTFNGTFEGILLPTPVLWGLALPTLLCMIIGLWLYLMRLGRAWMLFVWTAFLVTSLGLIMIINPAVDAQEQEITIKFFAPAHGFFAMLIGYGIAIALVFIQYCWKQIPREAMLALCAACLALPYITYRNNWELCSLNKFDFGYQFGYRMFSPGGGYPDMARDAVLFGGTDPGRFVPTYMIFCESAVKPKHRYQSKWMKAADPTYDGSTFDRSDVYIITQNALADGTYMSYIRDHYDHSRPHVNEDGTVSGTITNKPPWQQKIFKASWTLLNRQNAYPKKPIRIPAPDDNSKAFHQFFEDWRAGRAPPGADVETEGGRMQVRGAQGVMAINAILTRWIFDWNKDEHDFYVEESYVIQWMYPHLRPAGVIMKIEKEPLPSPQQDPKLWEEIVAKDTAYWDALTDSFLAREEFRRSLDAKKSFAKMRSAIAGLYLNRGLINHAIYAFEQAVRLCPESPEGSFRLAELYMNLRQYEKARDLIERYVNFDRYNANAINFLAQLNSLVASETRRIELQQKIQSAENPVLDDALELLAIYARLNLQNELRALGTSMLANSNAPSPYFLEIGALFSQIRQMDFALDALTRYTTLAPENAIGWIELGWVFISQNQVNEAFSAWSEAVRRGGEQARVRLRDDPRFEPIWNERNLPEPFRRLLPATPARPTSRAGGLLGQ